MTKYDDRPRRRVYAGKSQDERRAERYEQFIEAGIEVFGTKGYQGASVKSVCQAAGLTERYFYESFTDRESLLTAVYLRLNERLSASVALDLTGVPPELVAIVRAGLTAFFRTLRDDPRIARIILFEAVNITATMAELNRRIEAQFVGLIRDAVHHHAPAPHLTEARETLVVSGLFGAGVNIAMRWTLGGFREPLEDVVESTLLIYEGVTRQVWGG